MRFDAKALPTDIRARLRALEARARPKTLVGRVKAIVLSGHSAGVDFSDGESASKGYERAEELARELGELVAADEAAYRALLPLVVTNEQGRQWMFGAGLAAKVYSVEECWSDLVRAFEAAPEDQRNVQVLRGFLSKTFERDRAAFEGILEAALGRESLAMWVPVLQLSAPLDEKGCHRLLTSMENPAVPAWVFQHLSFGRATQALDDKALAQLLQRLSLKPDGQGVAIDVLYMHLHDNPNPVGSQTIAVARSLIANAPIAKGNYRLDHELAGVIEKFLVGPEAEPVARQVLLAVREGLDDYSVSRYDLTATLAAIFKAQPRLALDLLVGDEIEDGEAHFRRRSLAGGHRSSALARISTESLVEWCREGAAERWAHVASIVPAFETADDQSRPRWSDQALELLRHAPKPELVAGSLIELIAPSSWSGSRAEAIRQRLPLLDQLADALGSEHVDQVARWRNNLELLMERESWRELEEHRTRNERFE
jgi:hypothetical protein